MESLKNQYERNKAIEKLIQDKKTKGEAYSLDEISFINKYTGFGGMWKFEKSLAPDRGLYEYYTPFPVVEKMVELAYDNGYRSGGSVLEPSCGIGRFLYYFSPETNVLALEPDVISCEIARVNFPSFQIRQQTFNELFVDRAGKPRSFSQKFDLIIGNPPYGAFTGRLTATEKKATGAATYPEYFLRRGADILNPNGLMVFIIPSAWLETNIEIPTLTLKQAFRMPVSTFGGQTDVATDIVIYQDGRK